MNYFDAERWQLRSQTKNPILRWWGNIAGIVGSWFLDQADRYGDYYELDGDLIGEEDV
jgi:hypothetical protein